MAAVLRSCEAFGLQDVHVVENPDVPFAPHDKVTQGCDKWLDIHRSPVLRRLRPRTARRRIPDLRVCRPRRRPERVRAGVRPSPGAGVRQRAHRRHARRARRRGRGVLDPDARLHPQPQRLRRGLGHPVPGHRLAARPRHGRGATSPRPTPAPSAIASTPSASSNGSDSSVADRDEHFTAARRRRQRCHREVALRREVERSVAAPSPATDPSQGYVDQRTTPDRLGAPGVRIGKVMRRLHGLRDARHRRRATVPPIRSSRRGRDDLSASGAHGFPMQVVEARGIEAIAREDPHRVAERRLYVTVDVDGIDPGLRARAYRDPGSGRTDRPGGVRSSSGGWPAPGWWGWTWCTRASPSARSPLASARP